MNICNNFRDDGFGAQYQTIIFTILFCEITGNQFVYRPFCKMAHNYTNDIDFLEKKENLINIRDYFKTISEIENYHTLNITDIYSKVENKLDECLNGEAIKTIKKLFNKNKKYIYDKDYLNIAIHYRKKLNHDIGDYGFANENYYLKILKFIKNSFPQKKKIHLYSTGEIKEFDKFIDKDIMLHINEPLEQTFQGLVQSDVLFMSKGSFSYSAALISDAEIYYLPFWHKKSSKWKEIN
jgi:hypothetical protein